MPPAGAARPTTLSKRGGGEGDGGGAPGDRAAAGWLGEGEGGGTSWACGRPHRWAKIRTRIPVVDY